MGSRFLRSPTSSQQELKGNGAEAREPRPRADLRPRARGEQAGLRGERTKRKAFTLLVLTHLLGTNCTPREKTKLENMITLRAALALIPGAQGLEEVAANVPRTGTEMTGAVVPVTAGWQGAPCRWEARVSEEDPQERKSRPRGRSSGSSGPNSIWGWWGRCRCPGRAPSMGGTPGSRWRPGAEQHGQWPLATWGARRSSGGLCGGAGGQCGLSLVRFPVSRLLTAQPGVQRSSEPFRKASTQPSESSTTGLGGALRNSPSSSPPHKAVPHALPLPDVITWPRVSCHPSQPGPPWGRRVAPDGWRRHRTLMAPLCTPRV